MDKLDFIKIKNICSGKYHVKKIKANSRDWKKILNHISNTGVVA